MTRFAFISGAFAVWAHSLTDDPLSIGATGTRTHPTDAPAVLWICRDEAERARIIADLIELDRQKRDALVAKLPTVLAS